jgi:glycerol uptake facilitator-like aquaporin
MKYDYKKLIPVAYILFCTLFIVLTIVVLTWWATTNTSEKVDPLGVGAAVVVFELFGFAMAGIFLIEKSQS